MSRQDKSMSILELWEDVTEEWKVFGESWFSKKKKKKSNHLVGPDPDS